MAQSGPQQAVIMVVSDSPLRQAYDDFRPQMRAAGIEPYRRPAWERLVDPKQVKRQIDLHSPTSLPARQTVIDAIES